MQKSINIGVLIGNGNSPYSMELMKGIQQASRDLNVNIIYYLAVHSTYAYKYYYGEDAVNDFDYQNNVVFDYAQISNVDALIIAYGSMGIFMKENAHDEFLKKFSGIPYVLLGDRDETMCGTSIIADNYHGMYEVAEHLVRDQGYKNITYLAGPKGNQDADERTKAVWDVMKKYQIPMDESRIEYGDFSQVVYEEVKRLFDRHPDMEAMICANDLMAATVYNYCHANGISVGKDVAVTGYDDDETALTMNPPLTTVIQNAAEMGYITVQEVLNLLNGRETRMIVMPAKVKYRRSSRRDLQEARKVETGLDLAYKKYQFQREQFVKDILLYDSKEDIRLQIEEKLEEFLSPCNWTRERTPQIYENLKVLFRGRLSQYISLHELTQNCNSLLNLWLRWQICRHEAADPTACSRESMNLVLEMLENLEKLSAAVIAKSYNDRFSLFRQESWFIPSISRDMIEHIDSEQEFYQFAMQKLFAMSVRSASLFLFPEPITHRPEDQWDVPEKIFLVSTLNGRKIRSYAKDEQHVLTKENGLSTFIKGQGGAEFIIFCLYSGENQYGFISMESDPSNLASAYLISMQIANALKYYELSRKQKKTQRKLEKLYEEVQEKNEVLNFISEYDPMTGCLNRRGFLESVFRMNREHSGEPALLIFADLDHLKEINDTYGHMEGDFAIKKSTEVLSEVIGEEGIVGRLGGDEFVAMIQIDDPDTGKDLVEKIKWKFEQYNLMDEKPYYINSSMGYQVICFSENLVITEELKKADELLYAAKKQRRSTVQKQYLTEETNAEEEVNPLVGLINGTAFFRRVDKMLVELTNLQDYCLVAIDIEHFRMFNRWYGREEGDRFLKCIGQALKKTAEKYHGLAGYIGGDNFAVFLPYQMSYIEEIQQDINANLKHVTNSSGFLLAFGVYLLSSGLTSSINMYDYAVMAQSEVIGRLSNRINIYRSSMIETVEKEMLLVSEIKDALVNEEFTFYLQPQCDIFTGKIIGAEALVRWLSPQRGIVPPGTFIPILEKNGLISELDCYTWRKVCIWLKEWIDKGNSALPISINVSRMDFFLIDVAEYLIQLVRSYELPPNLIHVEITESAYAENEDKISLAIMKLRDAGFCMYMDDFGSGYSSLNALHTISIDVLKLDMRFLDLVAENRNKGQGIVETMVNLSRQIGTPIIMEGVETKEQEDFLIGMGCKYSQGFYYYRPMSIHDFEKLLSREGNLDENGIWSKSSEVIPLGGLINGNEINDTAVNNLIGPAAIYEEDMKTGELRILKVNDLYIRLCGATSHANASYGMDYFANLGTEEQRKFRDIFAEAYAHPMNGGNGKINFIRADGEKRLVYFRAIYLKKSENCRQFLGTLVDFDSDSTLA